jgi:hypothetical protein
VEGRGGGHQTRAGKVVIIEHLSFQGMELVIVYTGKIATADEIKFSRRVADFVTEELVAKRVKNAKEGAASLS